MKHLLPHSFFNRGLFLVAGLTSVLSLSACADPHFFPYERPLFAGLDHVKGAPGAQRALAEAKEDFRLALHDHAPVHARYVETIPYTHSKVYAGNGYRITLVHVDLVSSQKDGPQITIDSSITGGAPYTFDEIQITQI